MRVKLLILCAWMECYAGALKVLSFANDNDNEADTNGEFTSAELDCCVALLPLLLAGQSSPACSTRVELELLLQPLTELS